MLGDFPFHLNYLPELFCHSASVKGETKQNFEKQFVKISPIKTACKDFISSCKTFSTSKLNILHGCPMIKIIFDCPGKRCKYLRGHVKLSLPYVLFYFFPLFRKRKFKRKMTF